MLPIVHSVIAERSQARPCNGDLDFFEEHPMTTLLYRGNEYVQQNKAAETSPVQLTYRRNVYQGRLNDAALHNVALTGVQLTYRGVSYTR